MKYALFALLALGILPSCSNNSQPEKARSAKNMAREQAQEQQKEMEMDDMSMGEEQI